MATVEEQLAKKPFKKKSYRSYLSLGETLEDLVPPTPAADLPIVNQPIDKPEQAAVASPDPLVMAAAELTETQPTESTLTESQPTSTQSTETPTTEVQPTESQLAETQSTESQMAKSQRTERQRTKSKRAETQSTEIKLTESTLTESQSTDSNPTARNRRLTPKLTRTQLTESKLTESQSAQLAFSKSKSHWQLPEADVLDLLAETDPMRKLKGNEWPVFLYMSLRAFEWDHDKKSRGQGERRFAGSFLAAGTGLSASTCNSAINELIAKRYVELLEKDNYAGNLYRVKPVLLFRLNPEYADRKSVNQDSVNGQSDRNLNGSQSGTSPKVGHVPDRKSPTVLDPDRSHKSLDSLSPAIELYLSGCAVKKAERERVAFGQLQNQYGAEVLDELFKLVQSKPDIHSPGSFLLSSVDAEMKGEAQRKVSARARQAEEAKAKEEKARQQAADEKRQTEQAEMLERAFEERHGESPDAEHILSAYAGSAGPLRDVATPLGRGFALRGWGIDNGLIQEDAPA